MAETLGSLCDKLTVIKLKQWHADDPQKTKSLAAQEKRMKEEIDEYLAHAVSGVIPLTRLSFSANKVFRKAGNTVEEIQGDLGTLFSQLAEVNCQLWHVQEKVYEFEKVPVPEKNGVVKQLALLNLKRTKCMEAIDRRLQKALVSRSTVGGRNR